MTCRRNQGPGAIIISCTVAFTEQLTQFEVGKDLGLSVRQLRRQEKRALAVLADKIWTRYKLASAEPDSAPGPASAR